MSGRMWAAGLGIAGCLVAPYELVTHLHGEDWVVGIAGLCMSAVGLWGAWRLAKLMDEWARMERDAQRAALEVQWAREDAERRRARAEAPPAPFPPPLDEVPLRPTAQALAERERASGGR